MILTCSAWGQLIPAIHGILDVVWVLGVLLVMWIIFRIAARFLSHFDFDWESKLTEQNDGEPGPRVS